MSKLSIGRATLGRLPKYLEFLKECSEEYISSAYVAKSLYLGEVQVRKDLSAVSGKGKPRVGYNREELVEALELALGSGKTTNAIIVGAGKLGRALLDYQGFEDFGVRIIGAFDINEDIVQKNERVLPLEALGEVCRARRVKIGIIAVGEESAQEICDLLLSNGIKGIWNFAPCKLELPKGVAIVQENLALSLAHLKGQI
jgi:redox-sensing transcriptional repressor